MAELTIANACEEAENFIASLPDTPPPYEGRGIVICAGNLRYFSCAWVCINQLRRLGCTLPIQIWHLGPDEIDEFMRAAVGLRDVQCVDALDVRQKHPSRILKGWELKAYAVLNCEYREVLLLDADNVPVVDPTYLFNSDRYHASGAVFWPDFGRLGKNRKIWKLCGVEYRDEPEFESGQLLVDKGRCWKALRLAMWYNEHSDFYYNHIHGDKETFHLAFRKLGYDYAMISTPIRPLHDDRGQVRVMCQHDFEGKRVFQHRNSAKWRLQGSNMRIAGFLYEDACLDDLRVLKELCRGCGGRYRRRHNDGRRSKRVMGSVNRLAGQAFEYKRVGFDRRAMVFAKDGSISQGAGGCEVFWDVKETEEGLLLEISSETDVTCRLRECEDGVWRGAWLRCERMPIELTPTSNEQCKK